MPVTVRTALTLLVLGLMLQACGGGGSSSNTSLDNSSKSPSFTTPAAPLVEISAASPYAAGCGGGAVGSTSYENAEVEPYEAINPVNASNIIGVWQQDRWSDGGAHGLVAAASLDAGKTWHEQTLTLSVCAGGTSSNNANYARASDPWVSFSSDGSIAYVISISFTGNTLATGSLSSVLVTRSTDGGSTWGNPVALINDVSNAFNDKESITADPVHPSDAYAVWDRLDTTGRGPTYFSRTTDGGLSWSPAAAIYDPGVGSQTIGNEIVGLPDGTLLDLFEEIDCNTCNVATASMKVIRSTDQGATWSSPIVIAPNDSVGTFDPNTHALVRAGSGLPQMAAGANGTLAVVWQDARFSNGNHDDILFSQSKDDGSTWSTPVEINSVASTPAFTPSVAILADGTFGVSYFDFRNDPSGDMTSLPTDYWFTSSSDGSHWSEQHISGSFDLGQAPQAEGLFLGDYQALVPVGNTFVPFYSQTTGKGSGDPTDIYDLPPQPVPLHVTRQVSHVAVVATAPSPDAAYRQAIHQNLMHLLRGENPGWDQVLAQRRANTSPP